MLIHYCGVNPKPMHPTRDLTQAKRTKKEKKKEGKHLKIEVFAHVTTENTKMLVFCSS